MSFNYSLYFGNQQEARLGPADIPTAATQLLFAAEPLRLVGITLSNVDSDPKLVNVWIVPQGDIPATNNLLLGGVNVPPHDQVTFERLNIPLNHQDAIWVVGDAEGVNFFGTISRRNR